jgi:hypothetical protein
MLVANAMSRLHVLLAQANFDTAKPDPLAAWAAHKLFVREALESDEDGALFQCGPVSIGSSRRFQIDMVRQFAVTDDDYHLEQLHCALTCPLKPWNEPLAASFWSFKYETLDDYFTAIERFPDFRLVMSPGDWRCDVKQEWVS